MDCEHCDLLERHAERLEGDVVTLRDLLAALENDLRQVGRECCSHALGPLCLQWADRIRDQLQLR